jgi:hypothetical protein
MRVIGDIHGCIAKLEQLLKRSSLVDNDFNWIAGKSILVFVGDYTDRGEDGIAVIERVMHLERKAEKQGGQVFSLIGNHDILLLGAHRFGNTPVPNERPSGVGASLLEQWLTNAGGQRHDLERLEPHHVRWLQTRPAMLRLGKYLFAHADMTMYLEYGHSVAKVNQTIQEILGSQDILAFDRPDELFATRRSAFIGKEGEIKARDFLAVYGGECLVHGHTPIAEVTGQDPKDVSGALEYAGGLCINVDHGLYLGGEGFCLQIYQ